MDLGGWLPSLTLPLGTTTHPVHDELLRVLKDSVEGRLSRSAWREWWVGHAAEVEAQCDRFTFLRLKHRGFAGAISVLEQRGVAFQIGGVQCHHCGGPLFTAKPGETTVEQIREFAMSSRLPGREEIARSGWIHPGQYCPHGCTQILWHMKREASDAQP